MSNRELDYTRHYQRWHDDSDAHFERAANAEWNWIKAYLPADRASAILDIGCGMGFAVAGMQRAGYGRVQGIDADRGQIQEALRRGLAVTHIPVDQTISWMTGQGGRFAVVTAIDVLEHIPQESQLRFLEGVYGLLQPQGVFVCRVPNGNSAIASRYRYMDWTHQNSFTEESLDFVLYNVGFTDIRVEDATPYKWELRHLRHPQLLLLGFFRLFRRLEFVAELGRAQGQLILLGPNIVAIAKKGTVPT